MSKASRRVQPPILEAANGLLRPQVTKLGGHHLIVRDWTREKPGCLRESVHAFHGILRARRVIKWRVPLDQLRYDFRFGIGQETPPTLGGHVEIEVESHNLIDGAARGASDGLMLALNIGALLIAFISVVYLINAAFDAAIGYTFTEIMGWLFRPFAFLMGVPREDIAAVGQLLGTKTVINEFIAYSDMQGMIDAGTLSPRSVTIATYALCGFANPGSLGILIAGLAGLVPERRKEITRLGFKSLVAGTPAVFLAAGIAGIFG